MPGAITKCSSSERASSYSSDVSSIVLLGRELDPRHARVVDALAQERELARCDEVIDSLVQTLVGAVEKLLVLDEPVLSRCRHNSFIPGAPQPKTGSVGIVPVFDDRIPIAGHEHADARLVAVIGVDQVTARLFERDFVVPSGDANRLDAAPVAALAQQLARLPVEP